MEAGDHRNSRHELIHIALSGLLYSMEYLEKNTDWLLGKIKKLGSKYLIFDFPGQAELYTHSTCVKNVLHMLQKEDFKVCFERCAMA